MRLPRNAQLWLPGYLKSRLRPARSRRPWPVDVLFCVADHFEPGNGGVSLGVEQERVARWARELPRLVAGLFDADGRPPQHTFFYPEEQYRAEHLRILADLCRAGLGEVEVHLHHDGDTAEGFRGKLLEFTAALAGHGLLSRDPISGAPRYAFVHGNYALDNARRDGRLCGVNNELEILRETGCYADLTFPSAPDETQPRTVNRIYYATDDPERPRSFEEGTEARVGSRARGDLLFVQGPLALDWRARKWGVLPRIDNAEFHALDPATVDRFERWVEAGVTVRGRPEWVFVKVHTHGAVEHNAEMLLGPLMRAFHFAIGAAFNDGRRFRLHYVTAREMVNIARAAEDGHDGNPGRFRDYWLPRPAARDASAPAAPGCGGRAVWPDR